MATPKKPVKETAADKLLAEDGATTTTTTKKKAAPAKKEATTPKLTAAQQKKILAITAQPKNAIADTVAAIENVDAKTALPLVQELLDSRDFDAFRLGGLLSVIQANGFWREQGYEKFEEFTAGYFGIKYRKASYLMDIYNNLIESGVEWDDVKAVGWTKLKEIAKFLTVDNVAEWVERCNNMNTVTLIDYIKTLDENGEPKQKSEKKDVDPTENKEVSSLTFKLHTEQKELVLEAVEKAKKDADTEHNNVAMEYIATQYLTGALGKKQKAVKQKTLDELMQAEYDADPETALETLLNKVAEMYPEFDIHVAPSEEAEEEAEEEAAE